MSLTPWIVKYPFEKIKTWTRTKRFINTVSFNLIAKQFESLKQSLIIILSNLIRGLHMPV